MTAHSNLGGQLVQRKSHATISSLAHYAPPDIYENDRFERSLGVSREWILSRTGITRRHVQLSGATSDLIVPAALECLERARIHSQSVDCIIVATITPDRVFPCTAAIVQRKINATNAWGFDLSAACSGFVYGLVVASRLIESGSVCRVLLCGADKMTSITNYEDPKTSVLFGDAAGVVLLERAQEHGIGLLDFECRMDGRGEEFLYMPAGGSLRPASSDTVAKREHTLVQDGKSVFKAAVDGMSDVSAELMRRNNLSTTDVACLIPHQANKRIIDAVARKLGIPDSAVGCNIGHYGNTCAATIPVCLSERYQAGLLRRHDSVLIASFGAGFTSVGVL